MPLLKIRGHDRSDASRPIPLGDWVGKVVGDIQLDGRRLRCSLKSHTGKAVLFRIELLVQTKNILHSSSKAVCLQYAGIVDRHRAFSRAGSRGSECPTLPVQGTISSASISHFQSIVVMSLYIRGVHAVSLVVSRMAAFQWPLHLYA